MADAGEDEAPRQSENSRTVPFRVDDSVPPVPPLKPQGIIDTIFGCLQGGKNEKISGNLVATAKYSVVTFLPINLFEQFSRVANQYFGLIAAIQLIPGLSPTSPVTTLIPLGFVLGVNMVKEIYDDYQRHKEDYNVNFRKVEVLRSQGGSVMTRWQDIRVGDVVKLQRDTEIPADMVFLASEDSEGLCYVETANLDGESNLKLRYRCQGDATTLNLSDPEQLRIFAQDHFVECELPNLRLYEFDGAVISRSTGQRHGLDSTNLLLRGCTLRKTQWVVGLVVFAGGDTKVQQNGIKPKRKITQLEREMNKQVLVILIALMSLSLFSAIMDQVAGRTYLSNSYYLDLIDVWPDFGPGFLGFVVACLRFIILYNQFIPISLYVSLEVVKVIQCLLLNSDLRMYHPPTDTPFVCRTTTLNEDLGQVQYVLSDKTGTLTQNIMSFQWCSIAGNLYGTQVTANEEGCSTSKHAITRDEVLSSSIISEESKNVSRLDQTANFMLALAVCNSVNPHWDGKEGSSRLVYQAESPDEEALVEGAAELGFRLLKRSVTSCVIEINGGKVEIEIVAAFEFNSDRKRMSIVGRMPDGSCRIWCKGADNVILDRLGPQQYCLESTEVHLGEMSRAGYRTLCIAQRDLTSQQLSELSKSFQAASACVENREEAIETVAKLVENNLTLLGATAVEDKLQDGVPDTIAALLRAGIRVWVLTGDKVETAISIAVTCNLFQPAMPVVIIRGNDIGTVPSTAFDILKRKLEQIKKTRQNNTPVGLVIDGDALRTALHPDVCDLLLELCQACDAVAACRVSPRQKAEVTELVKTKAGGITLGIGDGANDVGMIAAAHIGCGISGREGRAAVLSSDFAFAQFCYLKRLLLVHGHWSFKRNEQAIVKPLALPYVHPFYQVVFYAFYKNITYVLGNFYFAFLTAFSAQPLYNTVMISSFNLIFACLPTIVYAVTEQNLSGVTLMANPEIYQEVSGMNRKRMRQSFGLWVLSGLWHSLVVFYVPMLILFDQAGNSRGQPADLYALGVWVYTAVIIVVNLKIALITRFFTWMMHVSLWPISIGLWFPIIFITGLLFNSPFNLFPGVAGVPQYVLSQPSFWLGAVLLAPVIAILPDFAVKSFKRTFYPNDVDIYQEYESFKSSLRSPKALQELASIRMEGLDASKSDSLQFARVKKTPATQLAEAEQGEIPPVASFLSKCSTITSER